ncbi:uncharacterized protein LOC144144406 [Haemaphysalis longicornis]
MMCEDALARVALVLLYVAAVVNCRTVRPRVRTPLEREYFPCLKDADDEAKMKRVDQAVRTCVSPKRCAAFVKELDIKQEEAKRLCDWDVQGCLKLATHLDADEKECLEKAERDERSTTPAA